jgi:hypothetical protein
MSVWNKFGKWLLAVDMKVNGWFGGSYRETISSRLGKRAVKSNEWAKIGVEPIVLGLHIIDDYHVIESIDLSVGYQLTHYEIDRLALTMLKANPPIPLRKIKGTPRQLSDLRQRLDGYLSIEDYAGRKRVFS